MADMAKMKSTVLTWGLISGGVSSAMMLLTVPFLDRTSFDHGEILGYVDRGLAAGVFGIGHRTAGGRR